MADGTVREIVERILSKGCGHPNVKYFHICKNCADIILRYIDGLK